MTNVFNKIGDIKNSLKRNSFDWSHDNNFTTDIGRITPVFCELVPPNSSVRIKPTFGLRFMPMMFPIQTKMKAYMSFYKVPLRTLWKDYKDFISSDNTEEYEPPYIKFKASDYKDKGALTVSGLGDYFGIPVPTVVVPDAVGPDLGFTASLSSPSIAHNGKYVFSTVKHSFPSKDCEFLPYAYQSDVSFVDSSIPGKLSNPGGCVTGLVFDSTQQTSDFIYYPFSTLTFSKPIEVPSSSNPLLLSFILKLSYLPISSPTVDKLKNKIYNFLNECKSLWLSIGPTNQSIVTKPDFGSLSIGRIKSVTKLPDNSGVIAKFDVLLNSDVHSEGNAGLKYSLSLLTGKFEEFDYRYISNPSNPPVEAISFPFSVDTASIVSYRYLQSGNSVYYGDNNTSSESVKVSAYPFRAYEAVYNAYIRNNRNNPFVLNGKKTYNTFITSDLGGPDQLTPLNLRYANWLSDAYTTALPSPQQGKAPLVGLTTYETHSLNESGHEVTTINTAIVDEDGNAYKVDFESNGEALKGVNYTPLKSGEAINMQSLVSPVTSGISINDFRNVNAYQRYLELNQFRGFSYKDIIEGRFDVNVRYDALNMPEYLGGVTRDIVVNPITQTVETSSSGTYQGALGSQSGQAGVFGSGEDVSVFCDEESVILGLMWVLPMPVYDSVLPKWLTYRSRLDSFNPEFDHIGYQPIYNSELAPLQCGAHNKSLMNVFGYQRPWYEYVQKLDRSHGLFLTELRNFIMYRSFSDVPELGSDFTTIQQGQLNNVFSVTEVSDKILGQIHFDCTAQLPISRVVVPRLE